MSDATKVFTGFVDLAAETKLVPELVEQIHTTEAGTYNEDFHVQVVGIRLRRLARSRLLEANVGTENHGDSMYSAQLCRLDLESRGVVNFYSTVWQLGYGHRYEYKMQRAGSMVGQPSFVEWSQAQKVVVATYKSTIYRN